MKLMTTIHFPKGVDPTALAFINGYSILVIADSLGNINFLYFTKRSTSDISFINLGLLNVNTKFASLPKSNDCKIINDGSFINKIFVKNESNDQRSGREIVIYASTNRGEIFIYNLTEILKLTFIKLVPHANTKANFDSDRIIHEDFIHQVNLYKIHQHTVGGSGASEEYDDEEKYNISLILDRCFIKRFQAHKDTLTSLTILVASNKKLVTSSLDNFIKFWTPDGVLLASRNINHPLPIQWNIEDHDYSKCKMKVLYAMKIIDRIFKRYDNKMLLHEQSAISINRFLKGFVLPKLGPKVEEDFNHLEPYLRSEDKPKVVIMKDEYSIKDIHFDEAKKIYKREWQGPTLRQLDVVQRLAEAQKAWKNNEVYQNKDLAKIKNKLNAYDQKRDKNDFAVFISNELKPLTSEKMHTHKKVKNLSKQLDFLTANSHISIRLKNPSLTSPLINKLSSDISSQSDLDTMNLKVKHSLQDIQLLDKQNKKIIKKKKFGQNLSYRSDALTKDSELTNKFVQPSAFINNHIIKKPDIGSNKVSPRLPMDFVDYATDKLKQTSEASINISSNDVLGLTSINFAKNDKKFHNKKFKSIISQLDHAVKKSQSTCIFVKPLYRNAIFPNSPKEKAEATKDLSTNQRTSKNESITSSRILINPNNINMNNITPRSLAIGRVSSLDHSNGIKLNTVRTLKSELNEAWSSRLKNVEEIKNSVAQTSSNPHKHVKENNLPSNR